MSLTAAAPATETARARVQALPLDQLDPSDIRYFVDDSVGHVFERLRREDPVHRSHSPVPQMGDYWSVTRYQDIMAVDTNPAVYSSDFAKGGITLFDFPPGEQQLFQSRQP